jgi:CPA2 family monovalent cation:H+ antiporter-2
MEIPLLKEIIIILGLSSIVVLICQRFKIPSIIGFLITGALAGPHGFGLIHAAHEVEMIAEIGIVFLLFTIGIEFSFAHLLRIKRMVLQGGGLQVGLTILLALALDVMIGQEVTAGIFIGFLLALSSTAIVLKLLQERQEMDSPHGKIILGILIFQDLVIVPMMLFTPLIAGKADNIVMALLILALKSVGVGVGVFFTSKWLMPRVLHLVTKTRNNELFLLTIIATCLVVAWLTSSIGLSLSLGAFLAGLIISESEYSHQAMSNILPFRDIFISFFFVSVGMLLDGKFFIGHWPIILALTLGVILLKFMTGAMAVASLKYPLRTALLSSLALAQVGEFAFVLSRSGLEFGLLTQESYQIFLAVSICTMVFTPLLIGLGPRTVDLVTRIPAVSRRTTQQKNDHLLPESTHLKDHLIIIGFGLNGKNLARAAKVGGIPYAIIETNPQTVQEYQAKGEHIFYGDATHTIILEHAHVKEARVAVVAISDPAATRRVTVALHRLNPKLFIIVRTRFVAEMEELQKLGASAVIPEEFETSIEIFSIVLQKYLVPQDEIESFTEEVRADGYQMLRSLTSRPNNARDLHLADIEISSIRVQAGSPLVGKTLLESELRQRYGVTLLAIRRPNETISNPNAETRFCEDDVLVILGRPSILQDASQLCEAPELQTSTENLG